MGVWAREGGYWCPMHGEFAEDEVARIPCAVGPDGMVMLEALFHAPR
jgi:hypothetical protein